jgi:hypothetical protein
VKLIERKQRTWSRLTPEDVREVKSAVHRLTRLRLDLNGLSPEQRQELHKLTRILTSEGGSLDAKQRSRWEKLVELGASAPDHFNKERRAAKLIAAMEKELMTPKAPAKLLAPGTVQLPPFMFEALQEKRMDLIHFMVLSVVISALQNRAPLHERMEVRGDAVVVDSVEMLLAPWDPDGDVRAVGTRVRELEDAKWLTVSRQGVVYFRLGPVLLDLLGEDTR